MQQFFERFNGNLKRTVTIGEKSYSSELVDLADDNLSAESAWWQSILRGSQVEAKESGRPLKIVDAFCGSGGLGLGIKFAAESVGRKVEFSAIIDTDQSALKIHEHNLGASRSIADSVASLVDFHVRGTNGESSFAYEPEVISDALSGLDKVDVFIAGPPCQGHSNLNNHTRRHDPRNELYVAAVALGVALNAKTIIIENVPTVQNSRSNVVNVALSLLRNSGYEVDHAVIRADELGAAQSRSRFFILAVKGAKEGTVSLKAASADLSNSPNPLSWAISDLLDCDVDDLMNTAPVMTSINAERIDYLFDNDLNNLPDAQRPDCHKNGTSYTAVYGRMYWDRPAQTITTGIGTPGQGRYIHPLRRRLITPHEAARIQGYPDWYEFVIPAVPAKRKNLAKWIGDAVHPMLGYAVGLAAMKAIQGVDDHGGGGGALVPALSPTPQFA